MKSILPLTLIMSLAASALPAVAQEASRFDDVRLTVRPGRSSLKEAKGLLISDPQSEEIRFERGGRTALTIAYGRISAMHYEEAKTPEQRWFKEPSYYLTVHYSDITGQAKHATVRLLSEPSIRPVIDALEAATGLTVERTLAQQSFLGIPIRAPIGDRVTVTDRTGQRTQGRITQLSASSLTLDGPAGAQRIFDESNVQRIRLPHSPGREALVGFGGGALIGGLFGGMFWRPGVGALLGGMMVAIGAADAAIRDTSADVYRGGTSGASRTSVITIAPLLATHRKGVLVSVGFGEGLPHAKRFRLHSSSEGYL